MMMLLVVLALARLILALTPHIHRVILTFRKSIIRRPIMSNNSAKYRAGIVLGNTTDHDPVGTRRTAIVGLSVSLDGKFEIGLLSVLEAEMFVVVVGMRVFVAT